MSLTVTVRLTNLSQLRLWLGIRVAKVGLWLMDDLEVKTS